MRIINHYVVEISDGKGVLDAKNEFRVDKHTVIAENDEYLAVDDRRFTTLKKGTSDYETCIDAPSISMAANDSCWGNRIWSSLYTERTVKAETIRKEIEKAVKKKYGFFIGELNLDVVKDAS
jgi:hypothetical protein